MKEFNAIEKLEAVKLIMETLGYNFDKMTVSEAFNMFRVIDREIDKELNRDTAE